MSAVDDRAENVIFGSSATVGLFVCFFGGVGGGAGVLLVGLEGINPITSPLFVVLFGHTADAGARSFRRFNDDATLASALDSEFSTGWLCPTTCRDLLRVLDLYVYVV